MFIIIFSKKELPLIMIIMRLDGDLCDQSSTGPNIALIIYGLMRCRNRSWGRVRDSLGSSSTVHIVNLQKKEGYT